MHCGQVAVQHICLPRYVWPHLGPYPPTSPTAFRAGKLWGPGLLLAWAVTQFHWLSTPLFISSELLCLIKGFCSTPVREGFSWAPSWAWGAWTETGLHAWGLVSCQREMLGAGLHLPSDRPAGAGLHLPSELGSQREGQGSRYALIPEDRVPSSLHAQSCRERHSLWGSSPGLAAFLCPSAECSVTGDIHFTTFDGRRYTFPATCQYILAKSRSSGTFTVTLQNAPCGLVRAGTPDLIQPATPGCRPLETLGI